MANAAAAEKCFVDQNYDDLSVDEFSNIDSSLVMSLIEAEDGDDGMVRLMIESLEPEFINQCSSSETEVSDDVEYRFCDDQQVESSCSTSLPDFEWIDTEMAYSCPSHEITGYFIGSFAAEFEGLEDYSQVCYDQILPMEEDEDDYIGLWQ